MNVNARCDYGASGIKWRRIAYVNETIMKSSRWCPTPQRDLKLGMAWRRAVKWHYIVNCHLFCNFWFCDRTKPSAVACVSINYQSQRASRNVNYTCGATVAPPPAACTLTFCAWLGQGIDNDCTGLYCWRMPERTRVLHCASELTL